MTVFALLEPEESNEVRKDQLVVVHPLDDVPESKIDVASLGSMPMTASVKMSLIVLRAYLILMALLVLYHLMDLAGVFS